MQGHQSSSITPSLASQRHFSPQSLARAIFAADSPEQVVASLPPETLYCIVRAQGVQSSLDLIELMSADQLRSCFDFDLWRRDRFDERALFDWLELPDAADDLSILERILGLFDLRLLGILISRYVATTVYDEPTDSPPGDGFVTPDKGYTWLKVMLNREIADSEQEPLDSHREFLLQRLLATVFDNSAELFYQILAIPSVATPSQLEEEAYQDREKRLQSLGIPDQEFAAVLNTPLSAQEIAASSPPRAIDYSVIEAVDPLIAAAALPVPLMEQLAPTDEQMVELDAEITLLVNAAIIHFQQDWHDPEQVQVTAQFVAGALQIGIEALAEQGIAAHEGWKLYGGQRFYAAGLHEILAVHRRALKIPLEELREIAENPLLLRLVSGLRERLPLVPPWIVEEYDAAIPHTSVSAEVRPFETLAEVRRVRALLSEHFQ